MRNYREEAPPTGTGVSSPPGTSAEEPGGASTASPPPAGPAPPPRPTAVGGTSLAVDSAGHRTGEWGWETSKATLKGSNLSWNAANYLYGSGGGVSRLFAQPSYQAGVVPTSMSRYYGGSPMRVVPDVSALGDPSTGMLVGQTQAFPDGNYYV